MLLVPSGKTVDEAVFRRVGKEDRAMFVLKNGLYFGRSFPARKMFEIMSSYSGGSWFEVAFSDFLKRVRFLTLARAVS
jgi:hypothetical protein